MPHCTMLRLIISVGLLVRIVVRLFDVVVLLLAATVLVFVVLTFVVVVAVVAAIYAAPIVN